MSTTRLCSHFLTALQLCVTYLVGWMDSLDVWMEDSVTVLVENEIIERHVASRG